MDNSDLDYEYLSLWLFYAIIGTGNTQRAAIRLPFNIGIVWSDAGDEQKIIMSMVRKE